MLISCIRLKFSREFSVFTAKTSRNPVSLLSVLSVSKKTAIPLHISVLSVCQSLTHFSPKNYKIIFKYASFSPSNCYAKNSQLLFLCQVPGPDLLIKKGRAASTMTQHAPKFEMRSYDEFLTTPNFLLNFVVLLWDYCVIYSMGIVPNNHLIQQQ